MWRIQKKTGIESNQFSTTKNVTLAENSKLILSQKQLAKAFKKFFVDIVPNLGITAINLGPYETRETNSIALIILKYKDQSSIKPVTNSIIQFETNFFSFGKVSEEKVIEKIKSLNSKIHLIKRRSNKTNKEGWKEIIPLSLQMILKLSEIMNFSGTI